MKTLLLIPMLGIAIAGSFYHNGLTQPVSHSVLLSTTSASKPTAPHLPGIWSSSNKVYKGENLVLYFRTPNPPYLGVITPERRFFYVVFPHETAVGQLRPFVESTEFRSTQQMNINLTTFKADPYIDGVYTNQPVFTTSGKYTFIMGDNLHTDDPNAVVSLEIDYCHQKRPAATTTTTANPTSKAPLVP
jgi:hypothetical protein